MLGLIDTIDPIKGFCSTEGRRVRIPAENVLNDFYIRFVKRAGVKKICMEFANPNFKGKYTDDVAGMEEWLGALVKQSAHDEMEISIRMDLLEQKVVEEKQKSA